MNNLQKLSDKDLFSICKKFGAAALEARRKFEGLLPEVNRRELAARTMGGSWLKKRGFSRVYDFAARLAGMSRPRVDEVLRLERRLVDKPVLHEALVRGEVSLNKLARVVSIATVENQEELLGKVEVLSRVALDVFVKDYKRTHWLSGMGNADGLGKMQGGLFEGGLDKTQCGMFAGGLDKTQCGLFANGLQEPQMGRFSDGLQMPQNGQTGLSGQNENAGMGLTVAIEKTEFEWSGDPKKSGTPHDAHAQTKKLPVNLDEDIAKELSEMMNKGIDVNELLREFLRDRKEKHEREKAEVVAKQAQERDDRAIIGYPAKRHVPAVIRKIVHYEFGDKCSSPGCTKVAENLHHEKGFARDRCHDPRFLKPLCRGHHELVHA